MPCRRPTPTRPCRDLQELAGYMRPALRRGRRLVGQPGASRPAGSGAAGRSAGGLQADGERWMKASRGMSDPAVAVQRQQVPPAGPDRGSGHAAVPAVRRAVRLAAAVHRDRVHRHAPSGPSQGWRHAQGMLNYELGPGLPHFTRSVLVQEPGAGAPAHRARAYDWAVREDRGCWTGYAMPQAQSRAGAHNQDGRDFRYYLGRSTCTSRAT